MTSVQATVPRKLSWVAGAREAVPLLGGYIPVAISFGLIA
ncbi:MAG: branched-chain amino acid ABC transporter permease, partial [Verrucomicrobiaceae bacterium]